MELYEYCASYGHKLSDNFQRFDDTTTYCGNFPYENNCKYSKMDTIKDLPLCLKPKENPDSIDDLILNNAGALE